MQDHWSLIERRLADLGCLEEMGLRPGASPQELSDLERHLGLTLPDMLKRFLSIHDGQTGFGLMLGFGLLSVSGIKSQWDTWRSLDEAAMNADGAAFMRSEPEGFVKPMYCNPAWIPLTHDGGGNHLGLDFDPDKLGTPGQIILFGRDEDTKHLVAGSFAAWLDACVSWLDRAQCNGEYLEGPPVP